MDESKLVAYTENVILLQDKDKLIGFISHAKVYMCTEATSEEVAQIIDPKFGEIARSMKRTGG